MNHVLRAALGLTLAWAALGASEARASPIFPETLQEALGLDRAPECVLCHDTPVGGFGTAQTPFATYLRSRGLRATDRESLRNGLLAAEGEMSDVDDDGATDIEELENGGDPNSAASAVKPPSYGCSLAQGTGRRRAGVGAWFGSLLALCAFGARRRRHAHHVSGMAGTTPSPAASTLKLWRRKSRLRTTVMSSSTCP